MMPIDENRENKDTDSVPCLLIKQPKTLVIGVGNLGNKVVSRLNETETYHISTIAIDGDEEDLSNILIEIKHYIKPDLVFVVSELDEKTNPNLAQVISKIAKQSDAFVVTFVTAPSFEKMKKS